MLLSNSSLYLSSTRSSLLLPTMQDVLFCPSRSILSSLVQALELIPVDSINQVFLYSDFCLDSDEERLQKDIEGWGEGEVGIFIHLQTLPTALGLQKLCSNFSWTILFYCQSSLSGFRSLFLIFLLRGTSICGEYPVIHHPLGASHKSTHL